MSETNPYAPPVIGATNDAPEGEMRFPEGEYGGIGRLAYFGYSFLSNIVQFTIVFAATLAGGEEVGGLANIFTTILGLVVLVIIVVQRLKNLGYSGWWTLGMFVPILNILVGIRLIAAPEGYADHKTLDKNGKIVVGIILGFIALVVVGVIVAVAASR